MKTEQNKVDKFVTFLKNLTEIELFSFFCKTCLDNAPESYNYYNTGTCKICKKTKEVTNPCINEYLSKNSIDLEENENFLSFHKYILPTKKHMIQSIYQIDLEKYNLLIYSNGFNHVITNCNQCGLRVTINEKKVTLSKKHNCPICKNGELIEIS